MGRRDLKTYLDELAASGAVTAAAAVVGGARVIESEAAFGSKRRDGTGRVTTSSLFDLASLTKPVIATLAQVLDADGGLPLRRSVSRALADAGVTEGIGAGVAPDLARKTLGSLLRHRSGFQPWTPLFARCTSAAEVVPMLASDPLLHGAAPSTYSDLGYILWGKVAEQAEGKPLLAMVRERITAPLGIRGLTGPPGNCKSVVAHALGNERERELAKAQGIEIPIRRAPSIGTIQDGNARFLGCAGHAGLFGSARALWRLAAEWVQPGRLLSPDASEAGLAGRGDYALGWRRRPPETDGRAGLWYGHLGFTGGGVWFCPESKEIRVLLTHRSSVSVSLESWRKRFLEAPV